MTATVTDLRSAKALREMGIPLNTPVIDGGPLPKSVDKAMADGFKAAIKFRERICSHIEHNSASTMAALRRAFYRFNQKTTAPHGDSLEARMIAAIFQSEFDEIREQWSPLFDAVDAGEEVAIDLRNLWPFVDTEATKRRKCNPML